MGLVIYILSWAVQIYLYMIIAYILMSWVPSIKESAFGEFLGRLVEPYLSIFRKIIPPLGMIDLSPIIAIFALQIAFQGFLEVLRWIV